jgi:hypothetical protein
MSIFPEWFEHALVPWRHFIPVSMDLSDLVANVQWAVAHDRAAQRIARRATQFAKRWLRAEDEQCWFVAIVCRCAVLCWMCCVVCVDFMLCCVALCVHVLRCTTHAAVCRMFRVIMEYTSLLAADAWTLPNNARGLEPDTIYQTYAEATRYHPPPSNLNHRTTSQPSKPQTQPHKDKQKQRTAAPASAPAPAPAPSPVSARKRRLWLGTEAEPLGAAPDQTSAPKQSLTLSPPHSLSIRSHFRLAFFHPALQHTPISFLISFLVRLWFASSLSSFDCDISPTIYHRFACA